MKTYPTIGCCGLDCGLCPRYYTQGPSRCPGCAGPDFSDKHPSCSFITCCVKKKGLEVCGECSEYPCPKFKSPEEYQRLEGDPSYPSYKKVIPNLEFIKERGVGKFVKEQRKRIKLLERMLKDFDDGRSKSFYCKTAAMLDVADLERLVDKAAKKVKSEKVKRGDTKRRAQILRELLDEHAINRPSRGTTTNKRR